MKRKTKRQKMKIPKRNYLEMINENNLKFLPEETEKETTNIKTSILKLNFNLKLNKAYEINNLSYECKFKKPNIPKIIEAHQTISAKNYLY